MLKEFKEFAMKGNVMDMAVGIIIGASFGKIVSSLVSDIIMPPIGMLVGGVDFSNLVTTLQPERINDLGEVVPALTLNYGLFINTIIDFTIVAAAIFAVIKVMNMLKRKNEEIKKQEIKHPTEIELLTEIRDSLKK